MWFNLTETHVKFGTESIKKDIKSLCIGLSKVIKCSSSTKIVFFVRRVNTKY